MTSITLPVSQEAREFAARHAENLIGLREVADRVRHGSLDDHELVQSFAKFETQIRNAILEEAAGVADKAAETAQIKRDAWRVNSHEWLGWESRRVASTKLASSIRQLGESGRP